MKQLDCVLGIDMGTGGARVGIFDLQGHCILRGGLSPVYPGQRPGRAGSRRVVGSDLQGVPPGSG